MAIKFIPHTENTNKADDAETLTTLDWGYALYLQEKKVKFKLGNTGATQVTFTVVASGVNDALVADTSFSTDDDTYESSASVVVPAGEVSDVIYAKHTVREKAVVGSGIVRLHVTEA